MLRLLPLFLGLCLAACQSDGRRLDEFAYVAFSWTGGDLAQMTDAWGKPNGGYEKALDEENLGRARWRALANTGGSLGGLAYACEIVVHFEPSGKIAEVVIVRSYLCKRHYGDDLSPLLRPGAKPARGMTAT